VAKNTIKLLDVVALTVDIPEYNLWRGQVGTLWLNCWLMVQRLRLNLAIATDALMNLSGCRREQIMVLYFEPASPDIKPEIVTV
jgi:hypothetical protein